MLADLSGSADAMQLSQSTHTHTHTEAHASEPFLGNGEHRVGVSQAFESLQGCLGRSKRQALALTGGTSTSERAYPVTAGPAPLQREEWMAPARRAEAR